MPIYFSINIISKIKTNYINEFEPIPFLYQKDPLLITLFFLNQETTHPYPTIPLYLFFLTIYMIPHKENPILFPLSLSLSTNATKKKKELRSLSSKVPS